MRRAPVLIGAAAIAVLVAGCGGAAYHATVMKYEALDPAHLGVTVAVTNTGSSPGTPTCYIQGLNPGNNDIGTGNVTMKGALGPGRTAQLTDSFAITNQGARDITLVTVQCA